MLPFTLLLTHSQEPPPSYDSFALKAPVSAQMLENTRHVPTITVMINGKGPYRFGIDTGASGGGRLDPDIAQAVGCTVIGEVRSADGLGKNARSVKLFRADKLTIGGLVFKGAILGERSSNLGRDANGGMDGILGFGLWAKLLLTLDYSRNRVEIKEGKLDPGVNTAAFTSPMGIPIVTATLAGQTIAFDLDSGNSGSMGFPGDFTTKLPLDGPLRDGGTARTAYNTFTVKTGTINGTLVLAGQAIEKPRANFGVLRRPNIGYEILRRFRVTIDEADGLAQLEG